MYLLLLVTYVLSFYKQGHSLIGQIVDITIDNTTRNNIGLSIENISPWADSVKKTKEYLWSRPLHYIDVPTNPEKGECDLTDLDISKPNLYLALHNYTERISDKLTRTDEDLKFFVHFYEDLFQPLHMSGIYRGGNNYPVNFFGDQANLHEVWDFLIIKRNIKEKGKMHKYIKYILDSLSNVKPYKPLDFDFWIKHNNRINCACVYKNLSHNVTEVYYHKNKEILDQLIIMASVNLKYILEKFYN